MTPCEKLGYKVGDLFTVVKKGMFFPIGCQVRLIDDDHTRIPLFSQVTMLSNRRYDGIWYLPLACVEPLLEITENE